MCTHGTVTRVVFDERFGFPCDACHEMGYGTCYKCANGCNYRLHEECWTATPEAEYSFFGRRRFILQCLQSDYNTRNFCTACGMAVKGLMYASTLESGVTIFLHPCCMRLPHRIEIDDGGGDMDRFSLKRRLINLPCQYCERTTLEGPIDGWAYVSADQQSACHVKCMKNRLYEDWIRYAFQQEPQGVSHEPWWFSSYADPNYDHGLDPCVGSSSSSPSRPTGSSQGQQYHNAVRPGNDHGLVSWVGSITSGNPPRPAASSQGQQTSRALTATRPAGRKRRILWKLTKVAITLLINFAIGNPGGVIAVVQDLF